MPLTLPSRGRPVSVTINPWSWEAMDADFRQAATVTASTTWPTANTARFFPFSVGEPCTAVKMFVVNGTVASGNLDLGIYDAAGTRLVSTGSTAQSGTSDLQLVDITDIALSPGVIYYAALVMDGTTGTYYRMDSSSSHGAKSLGLLQMASAFPLPATATMVTTSISAVPYFGVSRLVTI